MHQKDKSIFHHVYELSLLESNLVKYFKGILFGIITILRNELLETLPLIFQIIAVTKLSQVFCKTLECSFFPPE